MPNHVVLTRDPAALADREFDLLVIGGGIHGLFAAYDAASRGLSTALVERGDFGGATSFNHQKTAHGGLRSLQSGDLGRARESIRERRALARIAPRLLRPLPFLVGTYRSLTHGRLALGVGFRLDRALGRHRNDGLEPELRLPPPRLVSRAAAERLFPGIRREGLTGGATWYDYQIVEADRLTIGAALAAAAHGASLVNYAEAIEPLAAGGRAAGARVRDLLGGGTIDVRARVTLNAAGPFAGRLLARMNVRRPFPVLSAINLVTSIPAGDLALAARAPDGPMLTLTPWRGTAIVGTGLAPVPDSWEKGPRPDEISALIRAARFAFPALSLAPESVTLVHHGIVPAEETRGGGLALKRHADIVDHERHGLPGAITAVGVKYTTARAVAERAVDLAVRRLRKKGRPCRTAVDLLPGASIADHEALAIETERRLGLQIGDRTRERLVAVYGARAAMIVEIAAADRALAAPLAPDAAAIGAEIAHAIRNEAARRLDDVLMRRTGLGAGRWPGDALVARAAEIAGAELGWDEAARAGELARLRERYRVL